MTEEAAKELDFLKYTSKFTDAQLATVLDKCIEAGIVEPFGAAVTLSAETLAEALEGKAHVDVVVACTDVEDTGILEVLMSQPIHRGPASGKDQSAPHTRPNGSKSGSTRTPKADLGPKVAAPAADDPRIVATVKDNPKKPSSKSFVRYALYTPGISVKDFIAAGGLKADVKYDMEHGFITLVSPEEWAKQSEVSSSDEDQSPEA